jgi:hypothetical protein
MVIIMLTFAAVTAANTPLSTVILSPESETDTFLGVSRPAFDRGDDLAFGTQHEPGRLDANKVRCTAHASRVGHKALLHCVPGLVRAAQTRKDSRRDFNLHAGDATTTDAGAAQVGAWSAMGCRVILVLISAE